MLPGSVLRADDGWTNIDAETAYRMYSEGRDVVFINAMSILECMDHRIPGSFCIPCTVFQEGVTTRIRDKKTHLVIYCESIDCHRSTHAAQKALAAGYAEVFVLKGGLPAWKKAGYEVEAVKRIPRAGIHSIKPKILDMWMRGKKAFIVIDIRSQDLYDRDHLPDALNILCDDFAKSYDKLPMNKTLLVVDERGHRSFLAASYLYSKGFVDIVTLFGGMTNWRAFKSEGKKVYERQ